MLKTVEKGSGERKVRPVWNHAMRVNHKNFSNSRRNFAPTTVLTKSGIVPISTARQSSSRVEALVSTARPIYTAAPKPIVNVAKTRQNAFQKTHSLSRIPFHQQTALKNQYLVNTAKGDPQVALRDTRIFDSRCSRHMTGNKSFLSEYQEYDGGVVACASSYNRGKITGKGKFDGKANEGFLVGYSINSKAFRVYNSKTKKVEENMHVNVLENKPNVAGSGQEWLFDIDFLTNLMNYQPVSAGNTTNGIAGSKIHYDVGQEEKEKVSDQEYIL
nr:ribonuclease H-like domain-containing protein [Tanacetum cinerariifolium]